MHTEIFHFMPQALASLCFCDMLNFFWFLTKWGGGTNGVRVIPCYEVGQCQECRSSRSVLLVDWDETEATLMLRLDSVPAQVSAEQCASNASRAMCERTVPWLIKPVVVSNKRVLEQHQLCNLDILHGEVCDAQGVLDQSRIQSSEKTEEWPAECVRCLL